MVKKSDNMLSRFHLIPERYGQTTDRLAISISRVTVSVLTRDKNALATFTTRRKNS